VSVEEGMPPWRSTKGRLIFKVEEEARNVLSRCGRLRLKRLRNDPANSLRPERGNNKGTSAVRKQPKSSQSILKTLSRNSFSNYHLH